MFLSNEREREREVLQVLASLTTTPLFSDKQEMNRQDCALDALLMMQTISGLFFGRAEVVLLQLMVV